MKTAIERLVNGRVGRNDIYWEVATMVSGLQRDVDWLGHRPTPTPIRAQRRITGHTDREKKVKSDDKILTWSGRSEEEEGDDEKEEWRRKKDRSRNREIEDRKEGGRKQWRKE